MTELSVVFGGRCGIVALWLGLGGSVAWKAKCGR